MTENTVRFAGLRSPTLRRLIRAYGPVLLIALAFLMLVIFVPTLDRTVSP
jgi:hypothetical protein